MRRLVLTIAAVGAAALLSRPVGAAGEDAPKGDLAKIQGTWTAKIGPNRDIPIEYVFTGDAVAVRIKISGLNGREIALKGKVRLDETAKPHKAVDWLRMADSTGKTLPETLGIYALEGDQTLKLCNALPGSTDRPSEFPDSSSGKGSTLILTKVEVGKKTAADPDAKAAPAPCDEPKDKDKEKDKEKAPELKGDLKKIQGTWTAKAGPEKDIAVEITIKGSAVTLKVTNAEGQDYEVKGELKLDEAAKPHKTIDWVKFTNPNGEAAPENLGLYEFPDADTVRFCSGGPGNERPTEFKSGDGGPPNLVTMKRRK